MDVVLHCGDCLDWLRTLPDASVDAVVTDPPYNVGIEYASSDDRRKDYAEWCRAWFAECRRVCSGAILITPGIVNVGLWCAMQQPRWILCWHKPASMGRSAIGFNNWEPVLLYGKHKGRGGVDVFEAIIKPDRSLDRHPCPKPYGWAKRQVEMMTRPDDTILDPFMGSGTTGVACVRMGRRFLGCEIDPGYYAVAERRIAAAQEEFALFAGEAS